MISREYNGKTGLNWANVIQILLIIVGGIVFYFTGIVKMNEKVDNGFLEINKTISTGFTELKVKMENHEVRIGNTERHVAEDKILKSSDVRTGNRP